ncbi:LOW QUALITY PROTEIN: B-cell lymphoma/leukemia [Plakobranchus ocellatus]|uniref:B-cell lymphoma/leukemia n=1 Tax=Plakobranchus ocellatus TaxID=259542 RepID=A0AAV4DVY6_9GAST|nr:LOW QUALITY PROTEIN: B-cell lymphoma/leukemia [Plakobranchus ocellatus]
MIIIVPSLADQLALTQKYLTEPSRFVCETCRSTYNSAWALLQHAQKEHGMKIYTSPSSSTASSGSSNSSSGNTHSSSNRESRHHHRSPSATSTPIPSSLSPMDLVIAASSPRLDHRPVSASSAGGPISASSPYPVQHAPNPFTSPFRLPNMDPRISQPTSLSPYARGPPSSLDFDLITDYRLRPQFLTARPGAPPPGLDPHSVPFAHPGHPFHDRSRAAHISPVQLDYDYYSMRLKQLAGSPVIGGGSGSKSPFSAAAASAALAHQQQQQQQARSNSDRHTPTHRHSSSSSSNKQSTSPSADVSPRSSSASSAVAHTGASGLVLPKLKACEFCGKSFRFQSNLVVHRRSHTGEKPYKCSLCPHACTQQSKLKRHMKTHAAAAKAGSGTNDGDDAQSDLTRPKKEEADEDEDEEEDEEEEEGEEEEEEEIMEEEMNDEEREVLESMKKAEKSSEVVAPEPGEICHEAKKIKLENSKDEQEETAEEEEEEEEEKPSDLSVKRKPQGESVLSEVMKNSGLASIQTYTEAYEAALAENQVNGQDTSDAKSEKSNSSSRGRRHSGREGSPASPRQGVKRERESDSEKEPSEKRDRPYLGGTDLLSKSGKTGRDGVPATRLASHLSPRDLSLPSSDVSGNNSSSNNNNNNNSNGLNLSHNPATTTSSSALPASGSPSIPPLFKPALSSPPSYPPTPSLRRGTSSASSSPTGSLLLPSNGSSGTPRKTDNSKRNDTCEFCGKVFKNCSNLTVHRRSHTGEKPYKCSLCSYACAQSSKLTRHMKTHGRLGKDVYTCKFCNMPFSVPSTLEKHMRKCVENRNAHLMAQDAGDLSSESNGDMSMQSEPADMSGRQSEPIEMTVK